MTATPEPDVLGKILVSGTEYRLVRIGATPPWLPEIEALQAACRKALHAIAPCVVGWKPGEMPVWAEKLNDAVPDLQQVLGIEDKR